MRKNIFNDKVMISILFGIIIFAGLMSIGIVAGDSKIHKKIKHQNKMYREKCLDGLVIVNGNFYKRTKEDKLVPCLKKR